MKALIFGIDGGSKYILDYFNQPFLASLKTECYSHQLNEDLFHRGWAEIMTGKLGWDTGAFYVMPLLDGTHYFTYSFRMADTQGNPDIKPIWDLVGERGYKVGIMNVPTTTPTQKVNGFIVGSAGGGLDKVEGIPEMIAYPKSIIPRLIEYEYIVDIRRGPSGITNIEMLFEQLKKMERNRVEIFIKLSGEFKTDFGFLVDRATTVVQYLAMSEIMEMMIQDRITHNLTTQNKLIKDLLIDFYYHLDQNMQMLLNSLNPEHLIVTADHGHVPYKNRCNVNKFLQDYNWLEKPDTSASAIVKTKELARKYLPETIRKKISKKMPKKIKTVQPEFHLKNTKAFGRFYVPGIYINDNRRFNGPVQEGEELNNLVKKICESFNKLPEATMYEMSAHPYREKHSSTGFADFLPDIRIDAPETIFFTGKGEELVYANPNYGPLPSLAEVTEDMFTGQKSRHPILLMDLKTKTLLRDNDHTDLRVVYSLIDRIFKN